MCNRVKGPRNASNVKGVLSLFLFFFFLKRARDHFTARAHALRFTANTGMSWLIDFENGFGRA